VRQVASNARYASIALAAGFISANCSIAHAQTASEDAGPQTLETVMVTAQRRSEQAVNVPIAITSVSAETLTNAQIYDFSELGELVPGVVIGRTGAFTQPEIRGISTQASGAGGENNVGTYLDGFYQAFQGSLLNDLDNVTGIDVLKGPQGTLFGRNSTGGAIMINTQAPTAEPRGTLAVQGGSFDELRASADYSGPINDQLSFDVHTYKRNSNNYFTDWATGNPSAPINNFGIGGKLKYQPSSDFTLLLSYDYRSRQDPSPFMYEFVQYQAAAAPPYPANSYTSTAQNVTSLSVPTHVNELFASYGAHAIWNTPIGDFNSYSNYQSNQTKENFDFDGSPNEAEEIYQHERGYAIQQEFNLVSRPGQVVDYTVGVYYYHLDDKYDYFYGYFDLPAGVIGVPPASAIPSTAVAPWVQVWPFGRPGVKVDSYAGYGDLTWNLGDRLHVTGGVRYTNEPQTAYGTVLGDDRKATYSAWTPRAVVRFDLDAHSNVYASFSQGFKSGTFNIFAPPFNPVQPERLNAYEVGYKTLQNWWSLDAATYYYNYKDMQVTAVVTDQGTPFLETTNAARSEIYGVEAQFVGELNSQLHVRASAAWVHARYVQYDTFSPSLPDQATGLLTTVCGATPCVSNLAGQRLLRAPDYTANLGLDYSWLVRSAPVTASVNIAYTSAYTPTSPDWNWNYSNVVNNIVQPANSGMRFATPAYTLTNFNLKWQVRNDLALSAFVTNAFNQSYLNSYGATGDGVYKEWGPPRAYGARIEYKF
jgi:iron complex outermembrane receptor protein